MAGKGKQSNTTALDEEVNKKVVAMLYALDNEDKMSQWEQDFVADISDKFGNGRSLTEKQFDKLETIYRKWN